METTTTILEIRATPKHLSMKFSQYAGMFSDAYVNIGTVDWGDGTVDTNWSHTYSKAGTYTITIKDCGIIFFKELPLLTKIIQLSDNIEIFSSSLYNSHKIKMISNAKMKVNITVLFLYHDIFKRLTMLDNVTMYLSEDKFSELEIALKYAKKLKHINIKIVKPT